LILATLALPRDLFLFAILPGWLWVGFWTAAPHPQEVDEEWMARQVMGRWLGTFPPQQYQGVERFRNGWTFAVATVLAVGLSWLCVFVSPYWWL